MAYTYCTYRKDFDNTLTKYNCSSGQTTTINEAIGYLYYTISLVGNAYNYRFDGQQIISNSAENIANYVSFLNINNGVNMTTGNTLTDTFETKINFAFYSGTTAFALYPLKINLSTYTGTTAPAVYALKSRFNTFTGTTAPTTYQTKSSINILSGTTLPAIYQSKSSINTYTGTTVPATYALKSNFNTYTGTTALGQFPLKTNFNTFTGTTAPATYLKISNFNTYSGTTVSATYLKISNFNTYSGTTLTNINTRLVTSSFNIYSGNTATLINTKIGSVNNGLTKAGTNIHLGGALTGATQIGLGANSITFTGTTGTLKYGSDLSINYTARSLVDAGYVTGTTNSTIIFKNNATQFNTPPTEFTTINFSSGHTLINRGSGILEVKTIYGSENFNTGKTTSQTSTSTTFADYLAHGFVLAGGIYRIEFCINIGNSTTSTNVGAQLLVDGTSINPSGIANAYRIANAAARLTIGLFTVQTLTTGSHSFRLQFNTSSGTATADYGWIIITRIS